MADKSARDLHAVRLLCTLCDQLPCRDCRGWDRGFSIEVWRRKRGQCYIGVMTREDESDVPETNSLSLDPFFVVLNELELALPRCHISEPSVLNLEIYDLESEYTFELYVLGDPSGEGLSVETFRGFEKVPLPEEITGCGAGLVSARRHLKRFRQALKFRPAPLRVGEVLGLEMRRFGLPNYVLTRPEMLGLILAAVGYQYRPETTAELSPEGRGELVLWAIDQLGNLRCQKSLQVPDRLQKYLRPLGT